MDAHSVPAAGGVGADASGAASDDPPAAAVEFGPRAKAAEHAEVVDQEERDLDGRTEDGWMQEGWAWVDVGGCGWMWMMDVVGVTLLLRCGGVYTAESDAQHPSTRRLSIYLEYLSPP